MPAQSFSDRVNEATLGVEQTGNVRTDVRTAFTTFQTSLSTALTTYGLNAKDKQAVDDKLIDLARYLEAALR
jgi:hypothetical protein